ncbi:MAG: response regulator [Candidatus Muirbacterium halophilum]|nr:response regulator [Candidatus Muirbacterium halophilum]MCK9475003.1 response regulator [Candidatus Muirbacterium halophilum]
MNIENINENKNYNILIVDDVDINRDFIKTVITTLDNKLNVTIFEAANGLEAFKKITDIPNISLVILDMMMPEYDGFYFLEKYSQEFSRYYIPIIVMSAAGDNEVIKKAYNYGIYDYFIKPLSSDRFLSFELKVKNAIKMREALYELDTKTRILENDLRLASKLQYQFLPKQFSLDDFEMAYYFKPYSALSGDYIDFFNIDEDKKLIILADVVGHGTASAIIAAILKTHTSDFIDNNPEFNLEKYVVETNKELLKMDIEGNLVTAFIGVYKRKTRELEYIIAGHPYPMIMDEKSFNVEFVKDGSFLPMGLFDNIQVKSVSRILSPGTTLIIYTDGIMEARDSEGKIFGLNNLQSFTKGFIETKKKFVYYDFVDSLLLNLSSVSDDISIIFMTIKDE